MVSWNVTFLREAESDLFTFDEKTQDRIIEKIEWLGRHFDEATPLPLSNILRRYCKLRIGSVRVIYTVEREKGSLIIRAIGPRDKIYKRFGVRV